MESTVKKCLFCLKYVQKCFICEESSFGDTEKSNDERCQRRSLLKTTFLLEKLLDISEDDFVPDDTVKRPCSWIYCCDTCLLFVASAKNVTDQIALLQKQFEECQTELKNSVLNIAFQNDDFHGYSEICRQKVIKAYMNNAFINGLNSTQAGESTDIQALDIDAIIASNRILPSESELFHDLCAEYDNFISNVINNDTLNEDCIGKEDAVTDKRNDSAENDDLAQNCNFASDVEFFNSLIGNSDDLDEEAQFVAVSDSSLSVSSAVVQRHDKSDSLSKNDSATKRAIDNQKEMFKAVNLRNKCLQMIMSENGHQLYIKIRHVAETKNGRWGKVTKYEIGKNFNLHTGEQIIVQDRNETVTENDLSESENHVKKPFIF